MKYTPATVAKAITAFFFSAIGSAWAVTQSGGSLDLTALLSALSAGLVAAGGVFVVPNKTSGATQSDPVEQAVSDVTRAVASVTQAQQSVHDLSAQARAGAEKVQAVAADLTAIGVQAGSLVQQVIKASVR